MNNQAPLIFGKGLPTSVTVDQLWGSALMHAATDLFLFMAVLASP